MGSHPHGAGSLFAAVPTFGSSTRAENSHEGESETGSADGADEHPGENYEMPEAKDRREGSHLLRIPLSDPEAITTLAFLEGAYISDDIVFSDGWLHAGSETAPWGVYRVATSPSVGNSLPSPERISLWESPCYGVFMHGGSIWAAFGSPGSSDRGTGEALGSEEGSVGRLACFSPELKIQSQYGLPGLRTWQGGYSGEYGWRFRE